MTTEPDNRTSERPKTIFLVSHTHWDREWYRTFQAFRARLVDAVDSLLDLLAADPGYRFVLDGQAVVGEDYLDIRPHRRGELAAACREGRLALGPWYVQPDSLLPSGEAHIRNLLEGRRVASEFGSPSRVAYTPDSFGHPSTFPILFAGFGLTAFVYWRGNPDARPRWWRWIGPDGTAIPARYLQAGYFGAAGADPAGIDQLVSLSSTDPLLMDGFDHAGPDAATGAVAAALAERTGATVTRALLDDAVADPDDDLPEFRGELLGGHDTNLLPGVWSARLPLKLRNRSCESALEGWAEPWAALGALLGCPDERPALRLAWRSLLVNQAHDSIGGCSIDAVHEQMLGRYDDAAGLAEETTARLLERIAGLGPDRLTPAGPDLDLAVFNPSPRPRTDVVRVGLDGYPAFPISNGMPGINPVLLAGLSPVGYLAGDQPVRVIDSDDARRVRILPGQRALDLELVVPDIPAFGYRLVHLTRSEAVPDDEDDGRAIAAGDVSVEAADDGTVTARFGPRSFSGLFGVEDTGDRGDSYDHDPAGAALAPPSLRTLAIRRWRHPGGIQHLEIRRVFSVPAGLDAARHTRRDEVVPVEVTTRFRVAPGVRRIDVAVDIDNGADDHRMRLLFPTGAPAARAVAATTLGTIERPTGPVAAEGWMHPAPSTFPHQGWISVNGLTVVAPGLPEASVTADGVITITALRAVGWLARFKLRTRPVPAGPEMPAPGAQCRGLLRCRFALLPGEDPVGARDAELGLRAVFAGERTLVPGGVALVTVEPATLLLSALKPAENGDGAVVRLVNPEGAPVAATIHIGDLHLLGAEAVRLDEEASTGSVVMDGQAGTVSLTVPGHGVSSVRLRLAK